MVSPRRCQSYLTLLAIINIFLIVVLLISIRFSGKQLKGGRIHTGHVSKDPGSSDAPTPQEFLMNMSQEDPRLITWIINTHLFPPSKLTSAIPSGEHRNWYSNYVYTLFGKKMKRDPGWKGVFVEAGAYDGLTVSNSIFLEEKGWTGLLVECNPMLLPKLKARNRKAWISDACLSPVPKPKLMNFTSLGEWPASAKLGAPLTPQQIKHHGLDWVKNKTWVNYEITCLPLYSILKGAGIKEVDFLSLDVEGAEIGILKGFPFEKLKIKVMIVEVHTFSEDEKKDLRDFLKGKGYELRLPAGMDDVYVLKGDPDLESE